MELFVSIFYFLLKFDHIDWSDNPCYGDQIWKSSTPLARDKQKLDLVTSYRHPDKI